MRLTLSRTVSLLLPLSVLLIAAPLAAQTILLNPPSNQAITQPLSPGHATTLSVNSLNRVLYVDPASHTDLVTQVNALFAACSHDCEVHIPAGNYDVAGGTILMQYATESLTGDGKDKVRITYHGSQFLEWRYTGATYDFNAGGQVSGFTINCIAANAVCLLGGSTIGTLWQDLNVYGPGGIASAAPCRNSQAFVFQNDANWMERWSLRRINIGGFCTNLHFMAPVPGGTDSFGYGLVDGVWTNQGPGSYGVVVDKGATVYHALAWIYQVNSAKTTAADEYFRIAGVFNGLGFAVTSENYTAPFTFAHVLSTGSMDFEGAFATFTQNNLKVDPGGAFSVLPSSHTIADSVAGFGFIADYAGTHQDVAVYPVQQLQQENPFVTAGEGYVEAASGASAPVFVYDPRMPLCYGTIPASHLGQPMTNLTPTFCVAGNGNIATPGAASFGGSVTAPQLLGPLKAPTGACPTPGAWVFSQDGHATFCKAGAWITKI